MIRRTCALLLLLAGPSWAGIAVVETLGAAGCGVTISPTVGELVGVACESQSNTFAASVTDDASGGSNTYTESVPSRGGLAGTAVTNFFTAHIANASATTVTCAGSCYGARVFRLSGGLAAGDPVDASTGSVTQGCVGTDCTAPPISTTDAGDAILSFCAPGNSMTSVAAPYANFVTDGNGSGSGTYIPGTTVTNNSAVFTGSSGGDIFGCSVVALKPAASGAPAAQNLIISPGSGNLTIAPGAGTLTVQ